jgi:hypothetical protein
MLPNRKQGTGVLGGQGVGGPSLGKVTQTARLASPCHLSGNRFCPTVVR